MTSKQKHWDNIFISKEDKDLGWYEKDANQTLKFLELNKNINPITIFIPGAGTSALVDELLKNENHLILNDISDEALKKLKDRISNNSRNITWLHHDISKQLPTNLPKCDLWIDRAVLHFLLEESEIEMYFINLKSSLKLNGQVLFAEFSTMGAPKCAGLELHRYSVDELKSRLGNEYELIKNESYTFINPSGDSRPYIYALFKKSKN